MKRKILTAVFMCLLVCLLAVSVGAAVTTYDDYAKLNKQIIEYNETELVVFDDGFVCPSSYIFADSESFTTDYSFLLAMTGKTYTDANVVELCVPEGVTSGGYFKKDSKFTMLVKLDTGKTLTKTNGDFWYNQTLKTVIFGTGFTNGGLSKCFFNGAKVEYVVFSDNSQMTTLPAQFFESNTTIKGIYLGNTITKIGSGTFQNMGSSNVFLMNTPNDTEPSRVYYFKADITEGNFYGLRTNATTTTWVFPKGVNGVGSGWNIDAMVNAPKNLVFLTDAASGVTVYDTIGSTKLNGTNIYFPNIDSSDKSNIACSANTTVFFGDSKRITYNGGWGEAADMSQAEHIYNPQADVSKDASCEVDASKTTYCFCGKELSREVVEGSALKHDYDYLNNENAILDEITYSSFAQAGKKTIICANCKEGKVFDAPALFTCLGYSAIENGSGGVAIGFTVNSTAITEYEQATGKTVSYGVFAALKDNLEGEDVFENGVTNECAIAVDMTLYGTAAFEIKIVGFENDTQKSAQIAMGAYVATAKDGVTEYSYMQNSAPDAGEKYCFDSFNEIVIVAGAK
ncbi:MAG: leucine-rich repeat protein [Clostridia bacterium]|nr:leucine-rich repeat protein [Clostridia bacterium]